MAVRPKISLWKYISANLWGIKVADENGSEYVIADSDGNLYQGGTKITASAAQLNALSTTVDSPVLITPKIDDTDAGVTITSANQTNASATITIPDIGDAADTMVVADTAQTLTNKTLTTPIIAQIYQDAGKTKLMTVPNTASDTLAAIAATQTLTNKTLTAPVLTNPATTVTLGTHDYGGAAVDWTLNAAELLLPVHKPTNAGGAVNAIVATTIRPYTFINATGQALTVKTAAGTGISIANAKTAMVMADGTNVIRLTLDA